ncbi:hypothetical protein BMS3Abin12_00883 [bacterium BMS3Abin12]|nr:hypothetical protein BMS3Abin12_00883 [bacterium BMS3Abin12]
MVRRARPLALLLAALALAGCANLGYYAQSVRGQAALLAHREPIGKLLRSPDTPAALKSHLALALRIRKFASRELGLPDNASYRSYVALDRPYLSWAVFAAPALSLTPVHWCYPVVGCAVYRGYFRRAAAEAFAARLHRHGDDVYVSGVPDYSTLGWFADPLPSTVIDWPAPNLAGLIFHELAHQELFVPGDSRFDESFAVAVQEAGVARWLRTHAGTAERRAWRASRRREATFYPLIATTRHRLARLYASERAPDAKRAGKARILRELRERYRVLKTSWGGYAGYDHWFDGGMNNAKLAALQTYREYVPAFRRLLARAHGNFAAFYATARALARLPKAQRDTVLGALSTCTKRPAGDACNCDGVSDSNDVGRASPALQAAQRGFVRRAGLGPPATLVIATTSRDPTTSAGRARPYR